MKVSGIAANEMKLSHKKGASYVTFRDMDGPIDCCWRRKWQPTPVFLPGESQGRGAWWAALYGVAQSQTRLK